MSLPFPINEEEIFQAAAALPPAERALYLETVCANQPTLRARLECLLGSHDATVFMRAASLLGSTEIAAELRRLKVEEAGERIGVYKLLEPIGEGGFGVVWVAEQEQPITRRVALKILKLEMYTKEVIARFEQERQALAIMDHPNIAKVFDAGATESGRPYFAMELVRGAKITEYCDRATLSTTERLNLFITVCQAVQHAHQKGIIHRDLKPSNILVTSNDGEAVPKIIDFGVAKATQGRLTEQTVCTQFQQMIGTPLYMSPEQAESTSLDVDTRADIYSLGVLLYELLTGRTPIDQETLARAGMDEVRRLIRDVDPPRPSTRVEALQGNERTTTSRRRHVEPARLTSALRGDLDWIVMKALEKNRARRYATANGLALDLQRHLASEPVLARPASNAYRFRRLVRRNRGAFAAAVSIITAVLVGFGTSVWQAARANREAIRAHEAALAQADDRKKAEASAREALAAAKKSEQVSTFLKDVLSGVNPWLGDGLDTTLLRKILDETAKRLPRELHDQPAVQAELLFTIGNTLRGIGEFAKAEEHCREALRLYRELHGQNHPDVANALAVLGIILNFERKWEAAEAVCREELAVARKLESSPGLLTAGALRRLGYSTKGHNGREAEALLHEALALYERFGGDDTRSAVIEITAGIAGVRQEWGDLEGAEQLLQKALALSRRLHRTPTAAAAVPLVQLARFYESGGRLADAEPLFREAFAVTSPSLAPGHWFRNEMKIGLGTLLLKRGQLPEAELLIREALAEGGESGRKHENVVAGRKALIDLLRVRGDFAGIEQVWRDSQADVEKTNNLPVNEAARSALTVFRRLQEAGVKCDVATVKDGTLSLECRNQKLPDLAIFKGLPITRLELSGSRIGDPRPLAELGLTYLGLSYTGVTDLSFLCTSPILSSSLNEIRLHKLKITDFSPLLVCSALETLGASGSTILDLESVRGRKLRFLYIGQTQVRDLRPIAGMPLQRIQFDDTPVTDITPLLACPTLRDITLSGSSENITALRALANVRSLSYGHKRGRPDQTPAQFWREYAAPAEAIIESGAPMPK